jgi:hypothetical protein
VGVLSSPSCVCSSSTRLSQSSHAGGRTERERESMGGPLRPRVSNGMI